MVSLPESPSFTVYVPSPLLVTLPVEETEFTVPPSAAVGLNVIDSVSADTVKPSDKIVERVGDDVPL